MPLKCIGWGDVFDMCLGKAIEELGPGKSTVEYLTRANELFVQVKEKADEIEASRQK